MASTSSSTPFFGLGEDTQNQMMQLQQQSSTTTSSTGPTPAPPLKKKRNQPGNPNPDAEVIALSPKTLMATNRFICEVCNKGFQREQNLQLHRRGHNLPWKLKQKTTKDVKRKVYLCPEPTCVHHDPSRALGDLTGIKKHYSRKHGEKKWKCEKCSKRYAVQSDWKAHSKICGTREYRCDCGTLFSRRDSFITHRAFCDALAQESARHPSGLTNLGTNLYSNNISLGLSHHQVASQIPNILQPTHPSSNNMLRLGGASNSAAFSQPPPLPHAPPFFKPETSESSLHDLQNNPLGGLMQLPNLQGNPSAPQSNNNLFNIGFFGNNAGTGAPNANLGNADSAVSNFPSSSFLGQFNGGNTSGGSNQAGLFSEVDRPGSGFSSLFNAAAQNESVVAHMSATALLQKAAQMGSITSGNNSSSLLGAAGLGSSSTSSGRQIQAVNFGGGGGDFHDGGGGGKLPSQMESENHLRGLISSFASGGGSSIFGGSNHHEHEGGFGGFNDQSGISLDQSGSFCNVNEAKLHQNLGTSMGGSDKLTLDFLGVGGMMRKRADGGFLHREQQQQQQQLSMSMSSVDSDRKSEQASQTQPPPFGSSKMH